MRNDTFFKKNNDDDLNDDEKNKGKRVSKQKTQKHAIKNKKNIEPTARQFKGSR